MAYRRKTSKKTYRAKPKKAYGSRRKTARPRTQTIRVVVEAASPVAAAPAGRFAPVEKPKRSTF